MRQFARKICIIALTTAFPGWLAAQTTPTTGPTTTSPQPVPVRDQAAMTAIQTAIAAMGGAAAINQIQNCVVTGTSTDSTLAPSTGVTFTWTYAAAQFRLENYATGGTHILVSGSGNPQEFHDGEWFSAAPLLFRTNQAYHLPALVLFNELNNPSYSIIYAGAATVDGNAAVHIQTRDDSDADSHSYTGQDWYFDAVTGLPTRVEYLIPVSQNASDSLRSSMEFSNFQAASGVLVPRQLTIAEGPIGTVATVSSVVLNASVAASTFVASTGGSQ